VFLDRDGVLNENRSDYVKSWGEVRFLPGVFAAMARLALTPFRTVLVTNQSPVGRGILSREEVESINQQVVSAIESEGGRIDRVYYCPHHPNDGCTCRKPRPGLLQQAAREMGLDLPNSYLIGDALSDVQAALTAGCSPILVLTGRGRQQRSLLLEQGYGSVPVVSDLAAAVDLVLDHYSLRKV
jgi:D-glycero-D-manno-heptose 1,7-bisphosphate phosphatase